MDYGGRLFSRRWTNNFTINRSKSEKESLRHRLIWIAADDEVKCYQNPFACWMCCEHQTHYFHFLHATKGFVSFHLVEEFVGTFLPNSSLLFLIRFYFSSFCWTWAHMFTELYLFSNVLCRSESDPIQIEQNFDKFFFFSDFLEVLKRAIIMSNDYHYIVMHLYTLTT